MLMMDAKGLIRRFNSAALQLTGYGHVSEVVGTNVKLLMEPEFSKHNDSE